MGGRFAWPRPLPIALVDKRRHTRRWRDLLWGLFRFPVPQHFWGASRQPSFTAPGEGRPHRLHQHEWAFAEVGPPRPARQQVLCRALGPRRASGEAAEQQMGRSVDRGLTARDRSCEVRRWHYHQQPKDDSGIPDTADAHHAINPTADADRETAAGSPVDALASTFHPSAHHACMSRGLWARGDEDRHRDATMTQWPTARLLKPAGAQDRCRRPHPNARINQSINGRPRKGSHRWRLAPRCGLNSRGRGDLGRGAGTVVKLAGGNRRDAGSKGDASHRRQLFPPAVRPAGAVQSSGRSSH